MLMDSSFFFTVVVAEIGFLVLFGTIGFFELLSALCFMVLRKYGFRQENIDLPSSSSSPPSSLPSSSSPSSTPPSSLPSSPSPPSSLSSSTLPSYKWTHDVFPSFRGEDVRTNFLSHFKKEFRKKVITPFIDNGIKRGETIGPELIKAIRRSKIAIVLISKNYATSKWCLNELVEIMKCKKELNQTVFPIFYGVPPSDVKKLPGGFGELFEKTCVGQKKEDTQRWRQAFAEMATIAGYDSTNWDDEAVMIEEIVTEISGRLMSSSPSRYMEGLIGMEAHMENMKPLICLGSDEVRTVGIWGPCGIGKTTIARVLHDQVSDFFQRSVFMTFKPSYARPTCSDDHDEKLHLEQQFLSQLINQGDIKIPHLGAAQDFVMGKKVLVVFDGVEQLVQLLAMPQARYFGPGSRIIITTQNLRLLNAFGIKHTYQVNFPPPKEALQIFCMSAFGQNSPKDGFEKLAWEVTYLAGRLPLGLRIMGSHFRGILSKQEWKAELLRLRVHLDGGIKSILKFSYDALEKEDKDLFLCMACFFCDFYGDALYDGTFEDVLKHRYSNVLQGLEVLNQRSLVSGRMMHNLLVQLGREIVHEEFPDEAGKRRFLVDPIKICEVLADNTGSGSIIGINLQFGEMEDDQDISERAFENMTNLQFLRIHYGGFSCEKRLRLPQGRLTYLSPQLRILHWDCCPLKSLPSNFNPKFLVKILMQNGNFEKMWEGIQPLRNLKRVQLYSCENLKELPDLSTATSLLKLELANCKSLRKLPSSIGNAKNLGTLVVCQCPSLEKLPSSIGNLINLREIDLRECSSLMELPFSIGKLTNLQKLNLTHCSNLVELPSSIENLEHLEALPIYDCSNLVELPSTIGNLKVEDLFHLRELRLSGLSSLVGLPSSIGNLTKIRRLDLRKCSSLVELPSTIGNLINLRETVLHKCSNLVELPSSIGNLTNLRSLDCEGCSNLVELPSSIGNLTNLNILNCKGCSNMVGLPSSIGNLTNLTSLDCKGCSNLVKIPSSIENLTSLKRLYFNDCSSLVEFPFSNRNLTSLSLQRCSKLEFDVSGCSQLISFPQISTNIEVLYLSGTLIKEVPLSIKSWSKLKDFSVTYCKELEEFPHVLDIITELELNDREMEEIPSWVSGITHLRHLVLNKCRKLVSLPQLPQKMSYLVAKNCDSFERLACSSPPNYSYRCLKFINCWKLNAEVRDIIIQTYPARGDATILPGREVPAFFTYRSTSGGSVKVKLDQRCFPTSLKFKVCILLVNKDDNEAGDQKDYMEVDPRVKPSDRHCEYRTKSHYLSPLLKEHLYLFDVGVFNGGSSELLFEFEKDNDKWEIAEYGVRQLY